MGVLWFGYEVFLKGFMGQRLSPQMVEPIIEKLLGVVEYTSSLITQEAVEPTEAIW